MINRKKALAIRKAHRYLGLFLGIQFLLWTVSGLYFSWTDIDEIHGDDFKQLPPQQTTFTNLIGTASFESETTITSLELLEIDGQPFYWMNKNKLVNALTGKEKAGINQAEAITVANRYMLPQLKILSVKL